MTKAIFTGITVLLALQLLAQAPAGGGRRNGGGQAMSIGHFYGRIVDAKTGKGIEAASVQLTQSSGTLRRTSTSMLRRSM